MRRLLLLALSAVCLAAGCGQDSGAARAEATTKPTYDPATGRLTQLTYDANKDGVIDTWTDMDGKRPLRSRIDRDQDGRIDRWEYYDANGRLARVGLSRANSGKPDAWAYPGEDGRIARVEVSSTGDEKKIDRWEHYDGDDLVRAEEDTNGDGRPDKWEVYDRGVVKTAAFDENGDGHPDRRLTYDGSRLVTIESKPDASGRFTSRVEVR